MRCASANICSRLADADGSGDLLFHDGRSPTAKKQRHPPDPQPIPYMTPLADVPQKPVRLVGEGVWESQDLTNPCKPRSVFEVSHLSGSG